MNDLSGFFLLSLRFGSAMVLYAFLGWSIYILWRELRQLTQSTKSLQIPPIHLSATRHADLPEKMSFAYPQIFIGRDPACEFYLDNETVSSRHVRLFFQKNQWWVEDLGSSNGSFLNEQTIVIPTVLTDNDQLRCGQALINISLNK